MHNHSSDSVTADQIRGLDAMKRMAAAKARLQTKAGVPPITQDQAELLAITEAQKSTALEDAWAILLMRGGVSNAKVFMGPLEAAGVSYGDWLEFIQLGAAITQVIPPGGWDGKTTDLKILALSKPEVPSIIPIPAPGWENAQGPPPEVEDEYRDLVRAIIAEPNIIPNLDARQKNLLILGQCLDAAKLPNLNPPPADQIIEEVLDRGDVALFAAPSKAGKSLFALGLAMAAATGNEFCGLNFGPLRRVFYFDGELSKEAIQRRSALLAQAGGDVSEKVFIIPLRSSKVAFAANKLAGMAPLINQCGADLVIVDCAYSMYPSDESFEENSNTDIAKFMGWVGKFAQAAGVAVLLVHHATKGDSSGKSLIDFSAGAGAFGRAPRAILNIRDRHIRGDKKAPTVPVLEIVASNYPSPLPRLIYRDGVVWRLRQAGDPIGEADGDNSDLWSIFPADGDYSQKNRPETRRKTTNWEPLWDSVKSILAANDGLSGNQLTVTLYETTGHIRDGCRAFVKGLVDHGYLRKDMMGLLQVNPAKGFSSAAYAADEALPTKPGPAAKEGFE